MSDTVVCVENLSKLYRLGEVGTGSLAHDVNRWWHRIRGKEDPYSQVGRVNDRTIKAETAWVWALKDINFEIKRGEAVGIIGRNGAGKSTLLKILSRVTAPTTGQIKVKGRIASLLEVGTGFHPDLTGRENIYLNGAILGMKRAEIAVKLDRIVDFSGCAAYLDTPVKRYSSGMQVRLAFAVAAHLDPEILIVDEVLAVGDAEFQKRCVQKMNEDAHAGKAILFVSHNLNVVRTLTTRGIVLERGILAFNGTTAGAISSYAREGELRTTRYTAPPNPDDACITAVQVKTSEGGGLQHIGKALEIQIEIAAPKPLMRAGLSFQVVDRNDQPVIYLLLLDSELPFLRQPGVWQFRCLIPHLRLYIGSYNLRVHLGETPNLRYVQTLTNICSFEVVHSGAARDQDWQPGLAAYVETAEWHVDRPTWEAARPDEPSSSAARISASYCEKHTD